MTREEVKEELNGYLRAKSEHQRYVRLLEEIETAISSISIDYSKEKVQSTPQFDKLAESIDKLNCIRNKCIERAYAATEAMGRTLDLIEQIENPTIKDILTRKYILDESFEKIAVEKRYTYRRITQLHGDAIMLLSDKTFPTISLKNVI